MNLKESGNKLVASVITTICAAFIGTSYASASAQSSAASSLAAPSTVLAPEQVNSVAAFELDEASRESVQEDFDEVAGSLPQCGGNFFQDYLNGFGFEIE